MLTLLFCMILAISPTLAWNLSTLGLDSAVVSHVSLVGTRAILCVPREDDLQPYTLIEAIWPDRPKSLPSYPKAFPSPDLQVAGNCTQVQSAVSSDWDGYRYLFVLDSGWLDICPPKFIVYDFITYKQTSKCVLNGVAPSRLNSLAVYGSRAFIGQTDPGKLIVYELHAKHWWIMSLTYTSELFTHLPPTSQLTIAGSILYMTSEESDDLYELNITPFRLMRNLSNVELHADTRGKLLGPPRGMVADRQGLYYCVPRDFVCLLWDTSLPLEAESHEVLLQSADLLPQVHQLFFDIQKQLWALTDTTNGTHCIRIRRPIPNYLWT